MLAPKGLFKGAAYIYMTLPLDKEYSLSSCWEGPLRGTLSGRTPPRG